VKQVLQVNGFTRSATTYTYTAVKLAFPQLEVTHSHDYLDLSYRAQTEAFVLACVRNPLDAIASTLVQINKENGNNAVIEQIITNNIKHLYVINKFKDKIIVSLFDDVVKDYNPLLAKVSKKYNLKKVEVLKEDVVKNLPQLEGEEHLRFGRMPRDNDALKETALARLNKPIFSSLLKKALNLYSEISEK
jgi:thiol-disulfide isomerase/thioredoxin